MEAAAPRDWRDLHTALRAQGWTIEQTTRGHYKAMGPQKGLVHFSDSGDHRAILNTLTELRRNGFKWPPPATRRRNGHATLESCPVCKQQAWDSATGECSACRVRAESSEPAAKQEPPSGGDNLDRLLEDARAAKVLLSAATTQHTAACAGFERAKAELDAAAKELQEAHTQFEQAKKRLVEGLG